jgi:predicted nuclease with TOPRIM domain
MAETTGSELSQVLSQLALVMEAIQGLGVRMDRLEGRMDKLEGRMDKLEGRMNKLEYWHERIGSEWRDARELLREALSDVRGRLDLTGKKLVEAGSLLQPSTPDA